MESIAAFQTIKDRFSDTLSLDRPLFVLHGPRHFGKSTITYAIEMWLTADVPDVVRASIQLMLPHTDSDNVFWNVMGKTVDRQSSRANSTSFMNMVKIRTGVTKKRVCFILDEMDALLAKPALMVAFIAVLRQLEASSYLCGFLGVSRHDLGRHCDFGPGNLYKEVNLLKAEPFSTGQMATFFELIEPRSNFTKSLRRAIMQSSSGAHCVFGSMVRLTVDHVKWTNEGCEWELWFKQLRISLLLTNDISNF
ncbi:hypothetical protein PHYSODRAFT_301650 [Phytophthora sojae]|uniref:ORC1/DEAH AAA+ ATPase domain-containing protein n=1 Tax=Phytophthora sojae (strain P6497) TaxID=1094619 RepID=G4ZK59_PHYSP|nr:hypothetical protein PHYSODRAFT_301650 [Phytophthora sojae]EGZ14863.1 hypothetical protein PHYSODRAFT_301650 [Phytophthora sojae]|eukprot:XP_009528612.1 hypothetical protein PHYSODRAFT_301650 [Phytophthora sojae]